MGTSIAKGISEPIVALAARLKTFAKGNLSDDFPTADSQDEVAEMIQTSNEMKQDLQGIIADMGHLFSEMAVGNFNCKSKDLNMYQGDFKTLLNSMLELRNGMTATIRSIEEASTQVSAEAVSESIEMIAGGIIKVAETSQEISTVAQDSANAINQAEEGVNQITEVVQSVSATAEESSATSEELSAQAENLDTLISKFSLPQI